MQQVFQLVGWSYFDGNIALWITRIIVLGALCFIAWHGERGFVLSVYCMLSVFFGLVGVYLLHYLNVYNHILEMIFFVTIAFFGVCFVYMLNLSVLYVIAPHYHRTIFAKQLWWILRVIAMVCLMLYVRYLFPNLYIYIGLAVYGLIALIHGYKKRHDFPVYKTYEHIYRRGDRHERGQ